MLNLYILTDPCGGPQAYVGVTYDVTRRLKEHVNDPCNPRMRDWIRPLKGIGLTPEVHILDKVPEEEAAQAESDAISMCRAIRGTNCLNMRP